MTQSEKENGKSGQNSDKDSVAYHIFPTSLNLLGRCFVILIFMRITKMGMETVVDEIVSITIFIFLVSSVLSYVAIRSEHKPDFYEKIADLIFLGVAGTSYGVVGNYRI